MAKVDVQSLGEHTYRVEVSDNHETTSHEVTVPEGLRSRFQNVDEERLVRESFSFLLEREPPSSIMATFSLDVISRYFSDYDDELARRLG